MPDSSDNVNSGARASGTVDWSRPIEAVHEDGRVVSVALEATYPQPDRDGDYTLQIGSLDGNDVYRPDGSSWGGGKWLIRNVADDAQNLEGPTTPELDPALWNRMVALVRDLAGNKLLNGRLANEARAIVADLPKPVDPDLIEARNLVECTVHWSPQTDRDLQSGKNDNTPEMKIALAAIKRGRELAGEQA